MVLGLRVCSSYKLLGPQKEHRVTLGREEEVESFFLGV